MKLHLVSLYLPNAEHSSISMSALGTLTPGAAGALGLGREPWNLFAADEKHAADRISTSAYSPRAVIRVREPD